MFGITKCWGFHIRSYLELKCFTKSPEKYCEGILLQYFFFFFFYPGLLNVFSIWPTPVSTTPKGGLLSCNTYCKTEVGSEWCRCGGSVSGIWFYLVFIPNTRPHLSRLWMLFQSLSLNLKHAHMTGKAEVLKGVVGLSHPSSGTLVKVLLPPLGSTQEIQHMLGKKAYARFYCKFLLKLIRVFVHFLKITNVKRFQCVSVSVCVCV